MPRFVILRHTTSTGSHRDLMFERGGELITFRADDPWGDEIEMEETFPHPAKFLEYEGELRRAEGRVDREDEGEFEVEEWGEAEIRIRCEGLQFRGRYEIKKRDEKQWLAKRVEQA
jgi:hypothetical protein